MRPAAITFEGAEILPGNFRNFDGRPDRFNPQGGKRYFNVVIPNPELAQQMLADGWNVKILAPREEGDVAKNFLKINVNFNSKWPPEIYRVSSATRKKVQLDVDTVGCLDFDRIVSADLIFNPNDYNGDGSAYSAFLQKMYVIVDEDALDRKYADQEFPEDEEVPFM